MFEHVVKIKKAYKGNDGIICLREQDDVVERTYRKTCNENEEQVTTFVKDLEDLISKRPRKDLGTCVNGQFCIDSSASIVNLDVTEGKEQIGACFSDGFDPKKYCIVGTLARSTFIAKESEMGLLEAKNKLGRMEIEYVQKTMDGFDLIKKNGKNENKTKAWVRTSPLSFAEIDGRVMIVDDHDLKNVATLSLHKSAFDPLGTVTFMGFPRLRCETLTKDGKTILSCANATK